MRSAFTILLDTNCLALAVLNHSTVADDADLKLKVAMVHEAITDFYSVRKQLENKKNQFSLHFKYLKLIFYRVWV